MFSAVENTPDESAVDVSLITKLLPWRMGPMTLRDFTFDGEWRSDYQWEKIETHLPDLTNAKIADIGCSSGYLTFELASKTNGPVFGFDPIERCWLQGELTRKANGIENATFLPFGLEEFFLFPGIFDFVACCGVLHHERDPLQSVKNLRTMVKPRGSLLLECMCLPGDQNEILIPESRYAQMRNAWIIPTRERIRTWLHDAGFNDVRFLYEYKITEEIQRKTKFAPYASLSEFLDPSDKEKTIEGYPAPWKAGFLAVNSKL